MLLLKIMKGSGAILCTLLLCLHTAPALAYLDPGTGSMLIQGLIGAIAAAALTVKLYWHKFKGVFRSKSKAEDAETGTATKNDHNE